MICSNKIGERITELRKSRGLSQQELSIALNVSRETVAKWENGSRDLKTEHTIVLADYFNVTCDELLRGIKAKNVEINKTLGLEDSSIEKLIELRKYEKEFEFIDYVLNNDDEESPEYKRMVLEHKMRRNQISTSLSVIPNRAQILKAINILFKNENDFSVIENIAMYLLSEFTCMDKNSESDYFKVTNKITKLYQEVKYSDISDSYLIKIQAQLSKLKDSMLKEREPNK